MAQRRHDGRAFNESRPLSIVYEGLDRVDGSARFGFGPTKSLASVSGPIEVRLASEHPSKSTFEVHLRPLSSLPSTESKSLASSIRALLSPSLILTRNPRTLIQLVVQAVSPVGESRRGRMGSSGVAACVNAGTAVLVSAGSVPMRGVVCAIAVGRLKGSGLLVVDPSEEEELDATGCFAFMFADSASGEKTSESIPGCECVWTDWKSLEGGGGFEEEELVRATEMARMGAEMVWYEMKDSVRLMGLRRRSPLAARTNTGVAGGGGREKGVLVKEEEVDDDKMEI